MLLNGLTSTGNTTYSESVKSRDHTEKMLYYMGADINSKSLKNGTNKIELKGLPYLKGKHFQFQMIPLVPHFLQPLL